MDLTKNDSPYFLSVYNRFPFEIDHGQGVYLFDTQGQPYLDFLSGIAVNALGYQHPAIEKALLKQIKRNLHLSNYFLQDTQKKLAQRLIKISGYNQLFFTNSGTEAIEGLLKIAKKWGKLNHKSEIIALKGSFHGRTLGALSITMQDKYQQSFLPLLPNCKSVTANDITELKRVVNENTLALFYEGIMGEGGIRPLTPEFITAIYELKQKFNFLVFADEIQTGVGRTGYFYYFQKYGFRPDGFATAKGLGGGLPLGAFLINENLTEVLKKGEHGTTYGGNPLACAAGLATVDIVSQKEFLNHVTITGNYFKEQLQRLAKKYGQQIVDVRGAGLMLGLEVREKPSELMFTASKNGLLCNTAGGNTLRFVPPLIIEKKHVDEAVLKLEKTLSEVFGH